MTKVDEILEHVVDKADEKTVNLEYHRVTKDDNSMAEQSLEVQKKHIAKVFNEKPNQ